MVVVMIMGVVGVLAGRLFSKGIAADKPGGFARALNGLAHDARQNATATGKTTRLRFTPQSVVLEQLSGTSTWTAIAPVLHTTEVTMCGPVSGPQLVSQTPTCPLATDTQALCYAINGNVGLSTTGACPPTNAKSGGTIFFRSARNEGEKYKVVVWGLTGLPKLVTAW
jgi:type II secretory pathway pseudopilin PulG